MGGLRTGVTVLTATGPAADPLPEPAPANVAPVPGVVVPLP